MSRRLTLGLLAVNLALGATVWAVATGRPGDGTSSSLALDAADARGGSDGGGGGGSEGGGGESGKTADGVAPAVKTASSTEGGGWTADAPGDIANSDRARTSGVAAVSDTAPLFRAALSSLPVDPPPAPPSPTPPPRLLGVIIGGTGAIAVMQVGDAPPVRLRVQDEVDGWIVTRIEAKRVIVRKGEKAASLWIDAATE